MKPTVAIVACVAIICVTILEAYSLHLGHYGTLLATSIGAILGFAGLACGWKIAKRS